MSLNQASNAFDLLGQAEKPIAPVRLKRGEGPALEVGWGSFHQGIGSSLAFCSIEQPFQNIRESADSSKTAGWNGEFLAARWSPLPCGISFF